MEENLEEAERRFESNYETIEKVLLGEGTYGKVYKARSVRTGEAVAMKQMKLDAQEEGVPTCTDHRHQGDRALKGALTPECGSAPRRVLQAQ